MRILDQELIKIPPVTIPPLLLSLGMPPAKRPASMGLPTGGSDGAAPADEEDGIGGAPAEGRLVPAPLLAPPTGPPDTEGALRSFVTAFLSCFPRWISPRRAPLPAIAAAGGGPAAGGGGGGPPKPGGGGGGGGGPPNPGGGGGGGGGGGPAIYNYENGRKRGRKKMRKRRIKT